MRTSKMIAWCVLLAAAGAMGQSIRFAATAFGAEGAGAPGVLAGAVQPFVDRSELTGAVMLVAGRDGVLDTEAVGWADIAAKKPMRTDSIFWIASQSKCITGAALMMLVDEGKVNVNDPVEKYPC